MSHSTWDKKLLEKRNKKVVEMYTYLYDVKRKRFDDVMNSLKWDYFFLEETTIKKILKSYQVKLPRRALCTEDKKGISVTQARNNKLIDRFNELTELKRMRIDDTLELLSKEEFYLQPRTIELIVMRWSYYKPKQELELFN